MGLCSAYECANMFIRLELERAMASLKSCRLFVLQPEIFVVFFAYAYKYVSLHEINTVVLKALSRSWNRGSDFLIGRVFLC